MITCDHCKSARATVHITQISDTQTTVSHLCETCAREKGIIVEIGQDGIIPEVRVEAEALYEENAAAGEKEYDLDGRREGRECSYCHLTFAEFKTKGLLGCAHCYEEFEADIETALQQVHGVTAHKDKRFSGRSGDLMDGADVTKLRRELSEAIKQEKFERAAQLRDAIRKLDAKETVEQ